MITANLIQETEARFAQRQPIRLEREAKISAGAILEADAPERVKARMQHLARQVIETEPSASPLPDRRRPPSRCWSAFSTKTT